MDVLSKNSLRELLAFLEVTPLEKAISYKRGTEADRDVVISRQQYFYNSYPDVTTLIDSVPREVRRNVTGLITSVIAYVVSGSGHHIGNVNAVLTTRSILDILTKNDTGLITYGIDYRQIARSLTMTKMNCEQKKRMLICLKLLATKDDNIADYENFLNLYSRDLKPIAPSFNLDDARSIVLNNDRLSVLSIPTDYGYFGVELSIKDNNIQSLNRNNADYMSSNQFLREREEFNLIGNRYRNQGYLNARYNMQLIG